MLKKISMLIIVTLFSVSVAGCGHIKKVFKEDKSKKKSEVQYNTGNTVHA
jgi:cbb3-type cytochrome oxidase cytochrome c subunit